MNYYNEIDKDAAEQIRGLIAAGLIPDGVVDERSIEDIAPNELLGYSQLHFFAGIAGWPHALDLAGWPRSVPCITGSCPCQPFSSAGQGAGFDDERHLWPAFWHITRELRRLGHPAARFVFGEQVASPDALQWLDLVFDDLESEGYACWAEDSCSASVGAPHIRQRLCWVGHTDDARLEGFWLGHQTEGGRFGTARPVAQAGELGGLADARSERFDGQPVRLCERGQDAPVSETSWRGAVGGFWSNAEWIWCRDEKFRPVEPGTFPLAHGLPRSLGALRPELAELARVAGLSQQSLAEAKRYRSRQLKGYGNAINPWQAADFVQAVMAAHAGGAVERGRLAA